MSTRRRKKVAKHINVTTKPTPEKDSGLSTPTIPDPQTTKSPCSLGRLLCLVVLVAAAVLANLYVSAPSLEDFIPSLNDQPSVIPTQTWNYSVSAVNFSLSVFSRRRPVVLLDAPTKEWNAIKRWDQNYITKHVRSLHVIEHDLAEWMYEFEGKPFGGITGLPLDDTQRVTAPQLMSTGKFYRSVKLRSSTTSRPPEAARRFASAFVSMDPELKGPFQVLVICHE